VWQLTNREMRKVNVIVKVTMYLRPSRLVVVPRNMSMSQTAVSEHLWYTPYTFVPVQCRLLMSVVHGQRNARARQVICC
jgi:hypothetical protein